MTAAEISHCIAQSFTSLWQVYRGPGFQDYLFSIYGMTFSDIPRFQCIYIAELEEGDLENGSFGGVVKQWWLVDDKGLSRIRAPALSDDSHSVFDLTPVVRFYYRDCQLLVGESFGPTLSSRKVGVFRVLDKAVTISELEVIWTSTMLPEQGNHTAGLDNPYH